jgi:hypothetical protein
MGSTVSLGQSSHRSAHAEKSTASVDAIRMHLRQHRGAFLHLAAKMSHEGNAVLRLATHSGVAFSVDDALEALRDRADLLDVACEYAIKAGDGGRLPLRDLLNLWSGALLVVENSPPKVRFATLDAFVETHGDLFVVSHAKRQSAGETTLLQMLERALVTIRGAQHHDQTFDVVSNNCEHFAFFLCTGENRSPTLDAIPLADWIVRLAQD